MALVFTNLVPTMTSDTAPSGVSSAGSVYSSTYAAWKVFDKTLVSHWRSATGVTSTWLQYQFSSSTVCNSYALEYANPDNHWYMPYDWTFEASNTGSFSGEETVIDTQTAVVFSDSEKRIRFDFTNSTGYTYYRFNITSVNGGTNLYVSGAEIGLLEAEPIPSGNATISVNATADIIQGGSATITASASAIAVPSEKHLFTFSYSIQQSQPESTFKLVYSIEQPKTSTSIKRVSS